MKKQSLKTLRKLWQWAVIPFLFLGASSALSAQTVHKIPNTTADTLEHFIEKLDATGKPLYWKSGDTIMLVSAGTYVVNNVIDLYAGVTVMGDPTLPEYPELRFNDNGFRAKQDTMSITLKNLRMNGNKVDNSGQAVYLLFFNQTQFKNWDNILIEDVEAWGFKYGIQLSTAKHTLYKSFTLNRVYFHEIYNYANINDSKAWILDPNQNTIQNLRITNSTFANAFGFLKNPEPNGATTAQGLLKQTIVIDHNTFYRIGANGGAVIQINDPKDGSVDLTFTNNILSTVLDTVNSRPFLIDPTAGKFKFTNSVIHKIKSSRDGGKYVIDTVAVMSSATVSKIWNVNPEFAKADTIPYDFSLPSTSVFLLAGTNGKSIGDPRWAPEYIPVAGEGVHPIPNDTDSLEHFLETLDPISLKPKYWNAGDTILLVSSGTYVVNNVIDLYQGVTIMGDPNLPIAPELRFNDNGFRAKEDSMSITLKNLRMNGNKTDNSGQAVYILFFNQTQYQNWDNILIEDVEAWGFKYGIQLSTKKHTKYKSFVLNRVYFHEIYNYANINDSKAWLLDPNQNIVEDLRITNSTFANSFGFLKNPEPNGAGTVHGLTKQSILIDYNTFYRVGANGGALIQINDPKDGSVEFSFTNNIVSTVIDTVNSRPFLLDPLAGKFNFSNSVVYNFDSDRDGGKYNLDSVSKFDNIVAVDIINSDPRFLKTDTIPYNFTLPLNTELLLVSTVDGLIGDPRWFPMVGVTITPLSEGVMERDVLQLAAVATFGEGSDETVTWSVLNAQNGTEGEATISATGELTAVKAGQIAVVAVSNFAAVYSDTLRITIDPYIFVSTIGLKSTNSNGTETSLITSKGGSLSIAATVNPFDAKDKSITWSLDDDTKATLTTTGASTVVLTAAASGKVVVTATANDGSGVSGTIEITMENQRPVTSITVSGASGATEVTRGETLQMSATIEPTDADVKDVTWSVDKTNVATIDANGLLTAVAPGKVVVTASANDNSFKSGVLEVTVMEILSAGNQLATLYPNPAADQININLKGQAQVQIINLSGQVFKSQEINGSTTIDIRNLKSGVYLLKIVSDNGTESVKFTKK